MYLGHLTDFMLTAMALLDVYDLLAKEMVTSYCRDDSFLVDCHNLEHLFKVMDKVRWKGHWYMFIEHCSIIIGSFPLFLSVEKIVRAILHTASPLLKWIACFPDYRRRCKLFCIDQYIHGSLRLQFNKSGSLHRFHADSNGPFSICNNQEYGPFLLWQFFCSCLNFVGITCTYLF